MKKKKVLIQAIIYSGIIHLLYFLCIAVVGLITTVRYKPDITNHWNELTPLQHQVAFGSTYSPFTFLLTFIAMTFLSASFIILYRKLFQKP